MKKKREFCKPMKSLSFCPSHPASHMSGTSFRLEHAAIRRHEGMEGGEKPGEGHGGTLKLIIKRTHSSAHFLLWADLKKENPVKPQPCCGFIYCKSN